MRSRLEVRDERLSALRLLARDGISAGEEHWPPWLGTKWRSWWVGEAQRDLEEEQRLLGLCVLSVLEGQDERPGGRGK